MTISIQHSAGPLTAAGTDAIAVLIPADAEARDAVLGPLSDALGTDVAAAVAAVDVTGEAREVARIPVAAPERGRLLVVVGAGADPDAEALRRAAGTAVRNAPKGASIAIAAGDGADAARVQAVAEGAGLGAYAYTEHRKKPHEAPAVTGLTVVADGADAAAAVARAGVVVAAVAAARDMVNTPPADKRPPALAERMAALVADGDVTVTTFDEQALADGGFGGILGVGRGSSEPPRLVEMVYEPEGWDTHVVLVGKGITFDSGGLSLKPWKSMLTMKSDMAGAAAVAAALSACKAVGVKAKVTGLCALAENMPSGTATRPSDVLVHRGGTTVEVLNTDAEGRLVMADALAYGAESEPDVMIDLATLTGAQVVALGDDVAALMGTDEGLINDLQSAANAAGEQIWPLPLVERYAETLKSPVADLKNIGKAGHAGSITAGLFLRHFTAGRPWAHLDIAGPSFREDPDDSYLATGGTGFGVRTLLAYLAGL
ncbi:leucyl aminopeptidase [Euzebya sp.]|uniref:leucyl aminopeptidase n=1 Tax=Euzebya sp. TaxID=1971409 RepID=UPI0035181203